MSAVSYKLGLREPHSHMFEVEVWIPGTTGPVELVMPSWTPGSYLLREFARHVQDFRAETPAGKALPWSKRDKNSWVVDSSDAGPIRVFYRVYANELSVRTSHLDDTHGYVNGASVFMFVRGRELEPLELQIDAPEGWFATTSLGSTEAGEYYARNYDHLVDSPIEIGRHELLVWEQEGIPHRYAIWGRGSHQPDRLIADTRKIVEAARELFGGLPYAQYTFFLHLLPGGRGGLEHRDSCSLQADHWAFDGEPYENFLALVAHEFFHVWNAKRIRPEPLGPFDYTRENYTKSLWVVEGVTEYYTDLLLRRAGLITPERYLARLAESIARHQGLPGRHHQSLAESSFDTWIRFYRPDEHTPNSQISYYEKGSLVALLLDLEIQRRTAGEHSLDDVMRELWRRYGVPDVGFPEVGDGSVEAIASRVAGADLSEFFDRYVRGTKELDFADYLESFGLQLGRPAEHDRTPPGAFPARPADAAVIESRLGIRTRDQGGRVKIANALSGPDGRAGQLNAADEIVALDGIRIGSSTDLARRILPRPAADLVNVTLFRRDELRTFSVVLGDPPRPKLKISRVAQPSEEQRALVDVWLRGPGS